MYKIINKYMECVSLQADDAIYNRLTEFLKNTSGIKKYSVNVNFKRYVINIKMEDYSVEGAVELFNAFNARISYPYSAMHIRFNEEKCVRYRYITCKENREGFYCDIVLS